MKPSMMLLSQVRIPTATKSDLSSRSTRADESSFSDWMNEVSREPLRKQRTDDVDEDALRSAGMAGQTSPLDRSPERNNLRRADEHSRDESRPSVGRTDASPSDSEGRASRRADDLSDPTTRTAGTSARSKRAEASSPTASGATPSGAVTFRTGVTGSGSASPTYSPSGNAVSASSTSEATPVAAQGSSTSRGPSVLGATFPAIGNPATLAALVGPDAYGVQTLGFELGTSVDGSTLASIGIGDASGTPGAIPGVPQIVEAKSTVSSGPSGSTAPEATLEPLPFGKSDSTASGGALNPGLSDVPVPTGSARGDAGGQAGATPAKGSTNPGDVLGGTAGSTTSAGAAGTQSTGGAGSANTPVVPWESGGAQASPNAGVASQTDGVPSGGDKLPDATPLLDRLEVVRVAVGKERTPGVTHVDGKAEATSLPNGNGTSTSSASSSAATASGAQATSPSEGQAPSSGTTGLSISQAASGGASVGGETDAHITPPTTSPTFTSPRSTSPTTTSPTTTPPTSTSPPPASSAGSASSADGAEAGRTTAAVGSHGFDLEPPAPNAPTSIRAAASEAPAANALSQASQEGRGENPGVVPGQDTTVNRTRQETKVRPASLDSSAVGEESLPSPSTTSSPREAGVTRTAADVASATADRSATKAATSAAQSAASAQAAAVANGSTGSAGGETASDASATPEARVSTSTNSTASIGGASAEDSSTSDHGDGDSGSDPESTIAVKTREAAVPRGSFAPSAAHEVARPGASAAQPLAGASGSSHEAVTNAPANPTTTGVSATSASSAQVGAASVPIGAAAPVATFGAAQGPESTVAVKQFDAEFGSLPTALPRAVRMTLQSGGREAVLQLQPPELGSIRIQLSLDGDLVSTRIAAERPEVASRLERYRIDLERGLESIGLRLDHMHVETRGSGTDNGARQQSGFFNADGRRDGGGSAGQSQQDAGRTWNGGQDRGTSGTRSYDDARSGTDTTTPRSSSASRLDRRA